MKNSLIKMIEVNAERTKQEAANCNFHPTKLIDGNFVMSTIIQMGDRNLTLPQKIETAKQLLFDLLETDTENATLEM